MQLRRWLASALVGTLLGCYGEEPIPAEGPPETVAGLPDFELVTVKPPALLSQTQSGALRARLCNRGDTAWGTEVSFYLSLDRTFSSRDTLVTTTAPLFLSAGECRDVNEWVRPDVPSNHYFLVAVADADLLVREGQEDNNVRLGEQLLVDYRSPPRPKLKWVPGEDPTGSPLLEVTGEASYAYVYSGEHCEGTPVAESYVSGVFCYMPIDLSGYPASSYSVRVSDSARNLSECGTIRAPSPPDTTPPPAPVITEASWRYTSVEHALRVSGTTEAGAEVGVFIDARCTGTPAATVLAGTHGTFAAELQVPASTVGSLRRVFVAARDAAHNESACVEGPPYQTP